MIFGYILDGRYIIEFRKFFFIACRVKSRVTLTFNLTILNSLRAQRINGDK